MSAFELEVATMIVEALHLPDIAPDSIDPDMPLFKEGLGLDSIDVLELSLAIKQRYGVQIRSDDERNVAIFASLRALAEHLAASKPNE